MDAAYRRLHTHPSDAVCAITVISDIAYLLTRLPFGAVAGPSLFSRFSEAIFDLANDLVDDQTLNPSQFQSPISTDLNRPAPLPDSVPFGRAKPLLVYLPLRRTFIDGYIDDAISISVDIDDHQLRGQHAIPPALHSVFRPPNPHESSLRDPSLADKKLHAEGTPTETKTIFDGRSTAAISQSPSLATKSKCGQTASTPYSNNPKSNLSNLNP